MPDRLYVPVLSGQPTWKERAKAHTPELLLCLVSTVLGVLAMIGAVVPTFDPAPSIAELYPLTEICLGLLLCVGSAVWTKALLTTYKFADQAWTRIRFGSGLYATGWLVYAVTCLLATPEAIFPWAVGFTLSAIGYWCLAMTLQTEGAMWLRRQCHTDNENGEQQ